MNGRGLSWLLEKVDEATTVAEEALAAGNLDVFCEAISLAAQLLQLARNLAAIDLARARGSTGA